MLMDDYGSDPDAVAELIDWGDHIDTKNIDVKQVIELSSYIKLYMGV